MLDKTIIALARTFSGVALLITYVATGGKVDGVIVMTALLLLGIPVEQIRSKEQK